MMLLEIWPRDPDEERDDEEWTVLEPDERPEEIERLAQRQAAAEAAWQEKQAREAARRERRWARLRRWFRKGGTP